MREVLISAIGSALRALGAHGFYEVSEFFFRSTFRKNSQARRDWQQQSLPRANLSFFGGVAYCLGVGGMVGSFAFFGRRFTV